MCYGKLCALETLFGVFDSLLTKAEGMNLNHTHQLHTTPQPNLKQPPTLQNYGVYFAIPCVCTDCVLTIARIRCEHWNNTHSLRNLLQSQELLL